MKKLFLLSFVFMLTINLSIFSQVLLDGGYYFNKAISASSISIPCTTGVGTNRLMLVGVSWNCNYTNQTISTVTFTPSGGSAISLTEVKTQLYSWGSGSSTAYRYSAIYRLLNPGSGVAGTLAITFSGSVSNGIIAGVANFFGVDQSTPLGTPAGAVGTGTGGAGTNPSVTLTGLAGDELVFDNVFIGVSSTSHHLSADAGQSALWDTTGYPTANFNTRGASSIEQAAGSSVTMSWTTGGYGTTATRWAIAAVPIIWDQSTVPVELTTFTAVVNNSSVQLKWETATEVNNYGFDVERSADKVNWDKIAFVNGHGNSNSTKQYFYTDTKISSCKYYRLKQIDTDGTYTYSKAIEVDISKPIILELKQNYPNPFNPSTKISFALPQAGNVSLKVFNLLGQEVTTLVNGFTEAGVHTFNFNAEGLSNGMYVYQLSTNEITLTKKMVFMK